MNPHPSSQFIAALLASMALSTAGCDKKDDTPPDERAAGATAEGKAPPPTAEAREYLVGESDGQRAVVRFVPPEGWSEWRPSDKGLITFQKSGSRITASSACHGSCTDLASKLEENHADHASRVFATMERDPKVKARWVSEPAATAPGRYFFHVVGEAEDGTVVEIHAEHTRLDDDWARAVSCNVTLDAEQADMLEELMKICENLEVEVTPVG